MEKREKPIKNQKPLIISLVVVSLIIIALINTLCVILQIKITIKNKQLEMRHQVYQIHQIIKPK